jgi:5-formyltetrahydrofolate cyclo-ligase
MEQIPYESHDYKPDVVLTPSGIIY